MFVPTSDGKTKKLCCMYCLKRYPKLERHLRLVHKNEAEVKKFVALPSRKFFSCYSNVSSPIEWNEAHSESNNFIRCFVCEQVQ